MFKKKGSPKSSKLSPHSHGEFAYSGIISDSVANVWNKINMFGKMSEWHAGVNMSQLEPGCHDDEIGSVCRLSVEDDRNIFLRLEALDYQNHIMTYEVLPYDNKVYMSSASPFPGPMDYCHIRTQLFPVTDTGNTMMMAWCKLHCDGELYEKNREWIEEHLLKPGMQGLKEP